MMEDHRETHESFGMVGFSRISHGCSGTNLFASSIKHHNTIALRIKRATKERSHHEDRYYGGESLIEVEMSAMQFAEAITTLNVGDGVPCTIRRIGRQGVGDCHEETMRQNFEEEFTDACAQTTQAASDLINRAQEILTQKTLKKAERDELIGVLTRIAMNLRSNLPFIGKQFNEAMDKVTTDAKSTVEAFFLHRINELGVKSLQEQTHPALVVGPTGPYIEQSPNQDDVGSQL